MYVCVCIYILSVFHLFCFSSCVKASGTTALLSTYHRIAMEYIGPRNGDKGTGNKERDRDETEIKKRGIEKEREND